MTRAEGIAADLADRIRAGDYVGTLPSQQHLAAEYRASQATVNAACLLLANSGLIVTSRGRTPTKVIRAEAAREPWPR